MPAGPSWHRVLAALCAALLSICLVLAPARAQSATDPQSGGVPPGDPEVSLEYFREQLSPFGTWLTHPKWGEVWRPDAGPDFRPYFDGYWEYTSDHGPLWISNEPFGDIVYHYGRWFFDRDEGWLWVPGYVWGPSWVVWRANQDYIGWLPMPPGYIDYLQLFTSPYLYPKDTWYGYQTFYGPTFISEHYFTLWVFVLNKDFGHRDGHQHVKDIRKLRELYYGSADCTRYVVDQNRMVDRSLDRGWWRRHAGRTDDARPARDHLRRDVPITSVSRGRMISERHAQADRTRAAGERARDNSIDGSERTRRSGGPALAPRRLQTGTVARAGAGGEQDASRSRNPGAASSRALPRRSAMPSALPRPVPSTMLAPRHANGLSRPHTDNAFGVAVRRGGSLTEPLRANPGTTAPRVGMNTRPSSSLRSERSERLSGAAPRALSPRTRGALDNRGGAGFSRGAPLLLQRR